MPFFTVIIPTFNRKEFLKEAVSSVLHQTFKDFEIIIVDDHSTDGTNEIISMFQDRRISYLVNDRTKGANGARNMAIARAKGRWVAFLDDDDIWHHEKLEKLYVKINHIDDSIGWIYTGFSNIEPLRARFPRIHAKEGWIQEDLFYGNFIGTFSVVAVRADILRVIGGCDESFRAFQDGDLYVRIAGLSKVTCIREALTYVRISHEDRISVDVNAKMYGYKRFMKKHGAHINRRPKIKHRIASRIFVYATLGRNLSEAIKVLPWTLAGIVLDRSNMAWVLRMLTSPMRRRLYNVITRVI